MACCSVQAVRGTTTWDLLAGDSRHRKLETDKGPVNELCMNAIAGRGVNPLQVSNGPARTQAHRRLAARVVAPSTWVGPPNDAEGAYECLPGSTRPVRMRATSLLAVAERLSNGKGIMSEDCQSHGARERKPQPLFPHGAGPQAVNASEHVQLLAKQLHFSHLLQVFSGLVFLGPFSGPVFIGPSMSCSSSLQQKLARSAILTADRNRVWEHRSCKLRRIARKG